jgi:D-alanyl-D-alanine carboxypeptidase (penicillin-binding protein 5/6)
VDAGEGDRHERVSERADAHSTGLKLSLAAWDHEAPRGAAEREDPLPSRALVPRPEEETGRAQLETEHGAELHLELTLAAPHPGGALPSLDTAHPAADSIRWLSVRRLALLLLLTAVVLAAPGVSRADDPPQARARAVLVATDSGEILYERGADRRLPMASITKLMTALLTLERTKPAKVVTVRGPAPSIGESTFNLRPGERLRVRDLLTAALVQSANDAAYALAGYVGRGNVGAFVRLMNSRAAELGLDHTHYARPDGLDAPGQYSSARDILALARKDMEYAIFRRIVRRRGGAVAGRQLYAWNDLLKTYAGAVGVKTGHTDLADWCEVAAAERNGVTIYAVVLGSPSRGRRNADLARLLDWGFGHYGPVELIVPGRTYATARIPFSDARIPLVAARGASPVVRLGRPLVQRVVAPGRLDPPLARGQRVGEIRIYDGTRLVSRGPLVAAVAVKEPTLGRRLGWYAGRALDEAADMLASLSPF